MVQTLLLAAGLAEVSTYPPNVGHVDLFRHIRAAAREAGAGMWKGAQAPTTVSGSGCGVSVTMRVDPVGEEVDITNGSDTTINLAGWVLVSTKGDQRYTFPSVELGAGNTVTVMSGREAKDEPPRYLRWTGSYVRNNDGDPGELYDADGCLVASAG